PGPRADMLAQAEAAYRQGDWEQASDLARERIKQEPENPEALRLLARSAARLGRDASARRLFDRLRNLKTGDGLLSEDYYVLGIVMGRLGYTSAAQQLWDRGRPADVSDPEVLQDVARGYAGLDELTPAVGAAERLKAVPGSEARGALLLGMIRYEQ